MEKPKQKRALKTRAKILSALETLLADHEFELISIADIAAEGGVAVGSIYSHFEDKAALLPALLERRQEMLAERAARLAKGKSPIGDVPTDAVAPDLYTMVELSVRSVWQQAQTDKGVVRALLAFRRLNPDMDVPRNESIANQAFDGLVALFEPFQDEIIHRDLREACKMMNYFLNIAFLDEVVLQKSPMPAGLVPTREASIRAYTSMLFAYLTTPAPY